MKFKIVRKPTPNKKEVLNSLDYQKTLKFANILKKELGELLRSVVYFGSGVRKAAMHLNPNSESDIDVLLIINDVSVVLTRDLVETYRLIVADYASKISKRFHITTQKLTVFWDYVRLGDPIVTNMLRDGVAVYDNGIFEPMQHLLLQGKIRPTKEAIWGYYSRAPMALSSAKRHLIGASYDLYWACIDSAHSALMSKGHMPVTPEKVPDMIELFLVKRKILEPRYAQIMRFFYDLSRKITHRQIQEISGEHFDSYQKSAKEFVERMRQIVSQKNEDIK